MPDPIATYRRVSIHTAAPGDVLLALYDSALRHAALARAAIVRHDAATKGPALDRTIAILMELLRTLNPQAAPHLCDNLRKLYRYFISRLEQGSIHMDVQGIDEVIEHMQGLRETWAMAIDLSRQARTP